MASRVKSVLIPVLFLCILCTGACFAQNSPGDLAGRSTGIHPFSGFGEGRMIVEENGRVFIYQNLQTSDERKKRVIALTPTDPLESLTSIPDDVGRFDVKSISNKEGERGFIVKWTSLSDPKDTEKYLFQYGDSLENPNDEYEAVIATNMVQAASFSDDYLSSLLDDSGYGTDNLDDIWIEALIETGEHGMGLGSNDCTDYDSGGVGSSSCWIAKSGSVRGVACDDGYYACCKYNGGPSAMTAVCCEDPP